MADDTPDLISNISITGGDAAVATLQDVGDQGAAALDKLATSAQKSADAVGSASDQITKSLGSVNNAVPDTSVADHLTAIENAARSLGSSVRTGVSDVTSFGVKLAGVGVAAVGAIAGLAQFARSITAATKPPTDLTAELTKQQEKLNRQVASNAEEGINYANSIDDLNKQLTQGKLTYVTYGQAVTDLNTKFDQQVKAHDALQEAQRVTLEQNQKLQIQAEQTEAYNSLVKIYGTQLTGSLIQLGNQAKSVSNQLRDAFGPVLADLVDKIIDLINREMPSITALINSSAKALGDLVKQSGPSITQLISFLGDLGKQTVSVFQTIIIPGFKAFLAILDQIATFINNTFGTNISGTFLLVIAILGVLTGAFTALFSIVGIIVGVFTTLAAVFGGPIAIAIVAVTALLITLYEAVDWKALGTAISNAFTTLKTAGSDAITAVEAAFTAFGTFIAGVWTGIGTTAQALWDALKQGYTDFITGVQAAATAVTDAFNNAWTSISSAASAMYDTVKGYFDTLVSAAQSLLGIQSQASSNSQDSSSANTAAFNAGGHVRGPGGSTSDSIPAMLSNGEFVMRTRAVAKYGLGVMRALNNGALKLQAPAFANGGLVQAMPIQRFASGGAVAKANRVLNLTVGGETFQGLQMPEAVADRMTKFAVAKQVSSGGRKPAWFGGKQ